MLVIIDNIKCEQTEHIKPWAKKCDLSKYMIREYMWYFFSVIVHMDNKTKSVAAKLNLAATAMANINNHVEPDESNEKTSDIE